MDALKEFPEMEGKRLKTKKGEAFLQKTDIFKRTMYFSYRSEPDVFIPLSVTLVKEVLEANEKGELPEDFKVAFKETNKIKVVEHSFENVVGQDSLTRFDRTKSSKPNFKNNPNKKNQHKKVNPNQQKTQNQPDTLNAVDGQKEQVSNIKTQTPNKNRKPHHNPNRKNNNPNNDANKTNNPPQ